MSRRQSNDDVNLPPPLHQASCRALATRRGTSVRVNTTPQSSIGNNKDRLRHKAVQEVSDVFTQMRQVLQSMKDRKTWQIEAADILHWTRVMAEGIEMVEERVSMLAQTNIAETPSSTRYHRNSSFALQSNSSFKHTSPLNVRRKTATSENLQVSPPSHGSSTPRVATPSVESFDLSHDRIPNISITRHPHHSPTKGPLMHPSFQHSVTASIYLLMEAICAHVRAERGTLFQYVDKTEELQGVAVVGSNDLKPNMLRVPANCGFCGAVYTSGIAINVANVYAEGEFFSAADKKTAFRTRTILGFPIKAVQGASVIGVVQFLNKNRGTANFNSDDECYLSSMCPTLAYLLQHYPIDITHLYFDPTVLHDVTPFEAAGPVESCLPNTIAKYTSPTLVYRSTQPIRQQMLPTPSQSTPVKKESLREVAQQIANLEESWRNTISTNMQLEKEGDMKAEKMRQMRTAITASTLQLRRMKDKLQKMEEEDAQQIQQVEQNSKLLWTMAFNSRSQMSDSGGDVSDENTTKGNNNSDHSLTVPKKGASKHNPQPPLSLPPAEHKRRHSTTKPLRSNASFRENAPTIRETASFPAKQSENATFRSTTESFPAVINEGLPRPSTMSTLQLLGSAKNKFGHILKVNARDANNVKKM